MKLLSKSFFLSLIVICSCSSDDDAVDENGSNGTNGDTSQSCEDMPQYVDAQHQQFFSSLGSSCVNTSLYDHNQIGTALMVESDGSPECMIDTAFFKIHLGHADVNDHSRTFDVDIFVLTSDPLNVGDEIDVSDENVHVYYSYFDNNVIKSAKATTGSFQLEAASDADFGGAFSFTATEFQVDAGVDAIAVGRGSFVTDGDEVNISGRYLIQDQGLSPDCL